MIKNIIAALVLLVLSTQLALGQSDFKIGAKGGVNLILLKDDVFGSRISLFNYQIGAVGLINVTDKFSLQPELLYSTQRYSTESRQYHLDYINMPVLADFNVVKGLSLQAGPQFGLNVKKRLKMRAGDDTPGIDAELVNANKLSVGVGFGFQYKLPINIFFQSRYTLGLTNIYDNSSLKGGVISLSVGYFIF